MSYRQTLIVIQPSSELDQALINFYRDAGNPVVLIEPSAQLKQHNAALPVFELAQLQEMAQTQMPTFLQALELLDIDVEGQPLLLVQGVLEANEQPLFESSQCIENTMSYLDSVFLIYQSLATFIKGVGCNVIFPLHSDSSHYLGKAVNTVANHALNSFMKTLAKELTSDKVFINAVTIPYLAKDDKMRKTMRRELKHSVFGMRPTVFLEQQLIAFIADFSRYNKMMTAQCLTLSPNTEITV